MSKIILDSMVPADYGDMRITIERAKQAAHIDRSYTCFKGTGSVPMSIAGKCMWLAEMKKNEEYM